MTEDEKRTRLRYETEEAFAGDFTSLKERFILKGKLPYLAELMDIQKSLFQQFQDEVLKRLL